MSEQLNTNLDPTYETVINYFIEYENQPTLTPYQELMKIMKPSKQIKWWLFQKYMLLLETKYIEQVRKNPPQLQILKNTTYVYDLNKGIEFPNLCSIYKDIEIKNKS